MKTREYMTDGDTPLSGCPPLFYDAPGALSSTLKQKLLGDDRDPLPVDFRWQELSSRLHNRFFDLFSRFRLY
jgi:hypothetical protein